MALAEARAAWQRTANRCLVQEDAKRAPKLACCSSLPPSVKQADTGPTNTPGGQDIPTNGPQPFNRNPSYSNLSPNTRWWLQHQPNYGYQKGLTDEQCNSPDGNIQTRQMQESLDDPGLSDQTTYSESSYETNFTTCEKKDLRGTEDGGEFRAEGFFSSKNGNELYFDSESSWIGAEKNTPWWRTADTEELALLVAQKSPGLLENCDLPRPQNTRVKKDQNVNMYFLSHDEAFNSSLDSNPRIGSHCHMSTRAYVPSSLTAKSSCQKLRMTAEAELFSDADEPLRTGGCPTREKMPETHAIEGDASKAQLLEALCHSQTRAREAENAAKQACAEKEHVIKLVFRQASQLFAYKQWLHLLQLENMYFQFINNKTTSVSTIFPVMLPQRSRKMRKSWHKTSGRKRGKRSRPWYDIGKYAVVLALGLGLVGAGLLLGWTIGWMLPTWSI
ncbi:hypothetical protein BUALT_Bualt19G0001900 [Buddleja alternifolia]|uniref:Uncharacterized protein n=1 Tax=Buddleja alternifolia TaxID=168488 RepID=A0AAV6W1J7_9LAMI|nr:hypothetical protein BUALT_Bualt19G0001900 [Buddleja alternifolia]